MVEIAVERGDIESAIRIFRRRLDRDGIFSSARLRDKFPNKTDRKREKAHRANRRRAKMEGKRQQRENGREGYCYP